jgi:hypothetical protein
MELDNLKDIWKEQKAPVQKSLTEQELMTMISHPSKARLQQCKAP